MKRVIIQVVSTGRGRGKTLIGQNIVKRLVALGYGVCAIKKTHHDFLDVKDKDSYRYMSSGARRVVVLGRKQIVDFKAEPKLVEDVLRELSECDVVIIEGGAGDYSNPDVKVTIVSESEIAIESKEDKVVVSSIETAVESVVKSTIARLEN